ncbi:MAG: GNAT family N-acetyltransferase [Desulfobulbaceae bacterium]|nr:GNAT family N-acetyltransferase [Desulfobulbaceae bacterium]
MEIFTLDYKCMFKHAHQLVKLIDEWPLIDWKEDNFLIELPGKWMSSFAMFERGQIVGFCIASEKVPGVFYVHLFFVSPGMRGKNIGWKMMEEVNRRSRVNDMHKVMLRCPVTLNKAIAFYERNGFEVKQRVLDEISGPVADYIMEKSLLQFGGTDC